VSITLNLHAALEIQSLKFTSYTHFVHYILQVYSQIVPYAILSHASVFDNLCFSPGPSKNA